MCTQEVSAPVADTVIALVTTAGTVVTFVLTDKACGNTCDIPAKVGYNILGVAFLGPALVHTLSALHGYFKTAECRDHYLDPPALLPDVSTSTETTQTSTSGG